MKTARKKKSHRNAAIALAVAVVFVLGIAVGMQLVKIESLKETITLPHSASIEMGIPAVDVAGHGVVGRLITEVRPGTGKVLVNINDVLAQFDTQLSGRIAATAAAAKAGVNISTVDVIYTIRVNATVIEGPSAGASMAVSILMALQNQTPSPDVMITGTVDDDGSVGPVGSISEKAKAARDAGATKFLVPPGQATQSETRRSRECRKVNGSQFCRIDYTSQRINIGELLNMTVIEVSSIDAAAREFVLQK